MSGRHDSNEAHTIVVTKRDSDGKPSNVERWPTSQEFEIVGGHLLVYDGTNTTSKALVAVYAPGGWLAAYLDAYADSEH